MLFPNPKTPPTVGGKFFPHANYEIGGGWGDSVRWFPAGQFDKTPLSFEARYRVVGWKSRRPNPGETLRDEFQKSWMLFEFVTVEGQQDPRDMFFATVKPVSQIRKEGA